MTDDRLSVLLESVLAQFDLELESLDSVPAGRRRLLRVTVDGDGPDGRGPGLDEIGDATRAISQALDDADLVGQQSYTLEVSSRGVSRPLTDPKHWRRNRGRLVQVDLADGGELTGRIGASDNDHVTLGVVTDAKRGTTAERVLTYAEITRARIQVELNRSSGQSNPTSADAGNQDADEKDEG